MVQNADCVLAITDADKNNFINTYDLDRDKVRVFPVGVNHGNYETGIEGSLDGKIKCLITGSLWFGPNSDGAKWFIEKVWPKVKDICELTLAGSSPSDEIKKLCDLENIQIIESPKTMVPYFKDADMILAPVFSGAGMKVKIAEAMSYGLPVVTTEHGAIGYKIENGINGYICKDEKTFAEAIRKYFNMNVAERTKFLMAERNLYEENYSLNAIKNAVHKIVSDLIPIEEN